MSSFFSLTNQFKFCGNPFRIDTYSDCGFSCKYCFVKGRCKSTINHNEGKTIDLEDLKKAFYKAFESDKKNRNINIELLKNRVPLHLGGLSDAFQPREFKDKKTYELLKLTNEYNYPIMISTKCACLSDEYWEILNPDIHAFQISLISNNEDTIKKFERNTPSAEERINFMKELHNKNFWVGLRIQPLIHLKDALGVVKETNDYINYITVEHLKIPTNDLKMKKYLSYLMNIYPFYKPKKVDIGK